MADFLESQGGAQQSMIEMSESSSNPRWFAWGLLGVGVLGATLSGLSFREHLRSKLIEGYASFCNLGGNFNCSEVIASKYAAIFGIPTALFGVAFYLTVFFLGVAAWRRTTRGVQMEALLLSLVSGGASIILATISFYILEAVCILCVGIYTVSAIFFGLSLFATIKSGKISLSALVAALKSILLFPYNVIFPESSKDRAANNIALIGLIVTFGLFLWLNLTWNRALAGGNVTALRGSSAGANTSLGIAALDAWQRSLPQIISETKGEDLAWGPENAKVTVVEFTDFECPACRAVFPQLEEAIAEFKNDVRVIFKQYPLSSRCNPNLKHIGHKHACFSAQAALCMSKLGGSAADKIAHGLFTLPSLEDEVSSEETIRADILKLGQSLGVDEVELMKCSESPETLAIIGRNIKEGDAARIQGTPSIFIEGREVSARRSGQLKAVLRKALEIASSK